MSKVKMAFIQTFLLMPPRQKPQSVRFDTNGMTEEGKAHRDLLFQAHLNGHTVNMTLDGGDGPAIRDVMIAEVHSQIYEIGKPPAANDKKAEGEG